jgi:hypothetical protein
MLVMARPPIDVVFNGCIEIQKSDGLAAVSMDWFAQGLLSWLFEAGGVRCDLWLLIFGQNHGPSLLLCCVWSFSQAKPSQTKPNQLRIRACQFPCFSLLTRFRNQQNSTTQA